eukprot:3941933-Rhodomonas_salina.6
MESRNEQGLEQRREDQKLLRRVWVRLQASSLLHLSSHFCPFSSMSVSPSLPHAFCLWSCIADHPLFPLRSFSLFLCPPLPGSLFSRYSSDLHAPAVFPRCPVLTTRILLLNRQGSARGAGTICHHLYALLSLNSPHAPSSYSTSSSLHQPTRVLRHA